MEGERRGGVTGARSGRALMLPTERLPLTREDHLADPGSGAGGDGAGACREKKRRTPDNGLPAASTAPVLCLPAPQARGEQRFSAGTFLGTHPAHVASPSRTPPPVPPPLQGCWMRWDSERGAGVGHRHFRGFPGGSEGARLPRGAPCVQLRPLQRAGGEQEPRGQPGFGRAPEPVRRGVSDRCAVSNTYGTDITEEVRAWRSQGRNAGLSLSFRMCVTQSLFSARLSFNFL